MLTVWLLLGFWDKRVRKRDKTSSVRHHQRWSDLHQVIKFKVMTSRGSFVTSFRSCIWLWTSFSRWGCAPFSPVRTDTLFLSPSFKEITIKLYNVPGSRPRIWQTKAFLDSPSMSQSAHLSSSVNAVKLQESPAVLNFTTTQSVWVRTSVKFTEQWETLVDWTWNRKQHHTRWVARTISNCLPTAPLQSVRLWLGDGCIDVQHETTACRKQRAYQSRQC